MRPSRQPSLWLVRLTPLRTNLNGNISLFAAHCAEFRDSSSRKTTCLPARVSGTISSPAGEKVGRTIVRIAPPGLSPSSAAALLSTPLDSRTAVGPTPCGFFPTAPLWALPYSSAALGAAGLRPPGIPLDLDQHAPHGVQQ